MFRYVTRVTEPNNPVFARELVEDDIEEIATRVQLRVAIFKLHVDFSTGVAPWISALGTTATGFAMPDTAMSH